MQFSNKFSFKIFFLILAFSFYTTKSTFANAYLNEIDTMRAELQCIRDKNSPYYFKAKQKLEKTIAKYGINYTYPARIADVKRLIEEKKYNSAIYELDELINKNYKTSLCNELLADISTLCANPARRSIHLYKLAIKYDQNNASATFKLAKQYFKEKKNTLAIDTLKLAAKKTQDYNLLTEIANYINSLTPKDKLEANNLYEILGNVYIELGNKEGSYEAFKNAISNNPKDIYLKYYLTDWLYNNNQNELTLEILNSILIDMPNDLQIRATKAKVFARMGNIEEANRIYAQILIKNPNSIQARYGIFKLYENKLTPKEILKKVNLNKENYEPTIQDYNNFANMLKIMGELEAAEIFEIYQLNLIEPDNTTAKPAATKEIETPKQEIKQEIKKEIKKQTPKKFQNKKRQNKKTFKKQQPAIDNTKNELLKKQQEEKLKLEQEKIKKQQETLNEQKAIEQERKKAIAKNSKKYYQLKSTADKYLAEEPKTTQNYIAAANIYKQMGEPTSAIKFLKEAMKKDPTNSDIYYHLGLTYFEQNNTNDAKTNLVKSINLDKDNIKSQNLLAFVNQKIVTQTINKAYNLYQQKNYVSAFEILDKGIKEYPENSQLYYYRALVFDDMNRNAAAVIDLQKAVTFDPTNYMAFYQLGKIYEKIKNERSALVAYERFLSIEPDEKELVDEVQKKVIQLGAKYY